MPKFTRATSACGSLNEIVICRAPPGVRVLFVAVTLPMVGALGLRPSAGKAPDLGAPVEKPTTPPFWPSELPLPQPSPSVKAKRGNIHLRCANKIFMRKTLARTAGVEQKRTQRTSQVVCANVLASRDNQGIEAVARAIRVALVRAAEANSATNLVASGAFTLTRLCAQR